MKTSNASISRQEVVRSLGLTDSAVVVPCLFSDGREGWLGADEQVVSAAVTRPDGRLSVRRFEELDALVVFPANIGLGRGLNLALGLDLIRVRFVDEQGASVLEEKLRSLLGERFHEPRPVTEESDQGAGGEAVEPTTPRGASGQQAAGALGEEQPWYATVTGPAVDAFFSQSAEGAAAATAVDKAPSELDVEAHWKQVLVEHPDQVEPYRALFHLYYDGGDMEKAFWHAAVLAHFGVAEPLEQEVVKKYRTKSPIPPARTLDQGMWAEMLSHPSEDAWPGQFFGVLSRPLVHLSGRSLKSYGLKPKDRCDPAESDLLVARVFRLVQETLKLPLVEFYLAPDAGFELAVANVVEKGRWVPCCVAGGALLSGRTETEIAFILGRDLTYLMPQYMVSLLLPDVARQTILMLAATKLVRPSLVDSKDMAEVEAQTHALERLVTDEERAKLEDLVDRMVQDKVSVNLDRWNRSIQLTSHRVGLLLCQDLPVAVRLALTDPVRPSAASPEDRITEMVRFAVDDRHVRARRILGLAISG